MRYFVWLLRLGFAAWLVPAGLNHFYPLFPQPLGNVPESTALITALIDSNLFALVKAVELFAGICLMTGWRVPLALIMLLPVSFNVWYWDVPLQGWTSISAWYGWAVLGATLLLMAAYYRAYLPMLKPVAQLRLPRSAGRNTAAASRVLLIARLAFGGWMLLNGISHFTLHVMPEPEGTRFLSHQLIAAVRFSGLIDIAMAIQLVAGALVLAGRFMPPALAAVMPVNVCALYWAAMLEFAAKWAIPAFVAVALNALLMLALLPSYAAMLTRRPLAAGESDASGMRYETLYANPAGQTSVARAAAALFPLAGAMAFFHFIVPSMLAYFCKIILLYPLCILSLRLLQGLLVNPEREPAG